MADNIAVSAGVGTTIATDQVGTVHYQKIKLIESTADSETATGVAANPLAVALPTATVTTLTPPAAITGFATETTLASIKDTAGIKKITDALPAGTNIIGAVKRDVINYTPIHKVYAYTGAVTDGIVWSPTSGKKWVVTDIKVSISAAASVTFEEDKTGGDVIIDASDLAANGGFVMDLQTPWYGTENDADLVVTTTAGNVKVTVDGYEV